MNEDVVDSKASTQEIIDRSVKSAYTQGEPSTFSKLSDHPSRMSRQSAQKASPTRSQSNRHRDGYEDQFTTYTTLVKDGTQVERNKPFIKLSSIDPSFGIMTKNLQLNIPMGAKTPGLSPAVSARNRRGSVKEKKDQHGGHHLRTGSKSVSQPVSKLGSRLGSRRTSQKDILVLLPEVENEDSDDLELDPTDKWADFELDLDNIKSPDRTQSPREKETSGQYGGTDTYSRTTTLGYGGGVGLKGKGKLGGYNAPEPIHEDDEDDEPNTYDPFVRHLTIEMPFSKKKGSGGGLKGAIVEEGDEDALSNESVDRGSSRQSSDRPGVNLGVKLYFFNQKSSRIQIHCC